MTKQQHLSVVIAKLAKHSQRATYGAVGETVKLSAQSVMHGQIKSSLNSWVVSKRTGLPSQYSTSECAPGLTAGPKPIDTGKELKEWMTATT